MSEVHRKPRRPDRVLLRRIEVLEAAIGMERAVIDARMEKMRKLQAEHERIYREVQKLVPVPCSAEPAVSTTSSTS